MPGIYFGSFNRGYIYAKNTEIPIGWVAWGDNVLLHRPLSYDKEQDLANMVQSIDCHTLKVCC